MELFSTGWDIASCIVVFILGGFLVFLMAPVFSCERPYGFLLYFWHTFFCYFYAAYSLSSVADSTAYYGQASQGDWSFSLGTDAVTAVTGVFANIFGLSYLGVFLVFNVVGLVGLMAYSGALRELAAGSRPLLRNIAALVPFLPSISFWSTAIGKDAPAFASVGLMVWASLNLRRRAVYMGVALFVMVLVRPHIMAVMVFALGLAMLFQRGIPLVQRFMIGTVALLVALAILPFVLQYVGVGDSADIEDLAAYVENRQALNLQGDVDIDLSQMSPPLQVFSYMFRPFPFEANSLFSFAAAIDNLLLLSLLFYAGYRWVRGRARGAPLPNRVLLFSYASVTWLILALTTPNIGIATRQKWMIAPVLVFMLLSVVVRSMRAKNA